MELDSTSNLSGTIYKMSWVAYIKPVFIFIILFSIAISMEYSTNKIFETIGVVLMIACSANFICQMMFIWGAKVIINDDGVWFFRGIFPWTKGAIGTAWRDMADAEYFTGFISWLVKSYRIRVAHRFTKTSEIIIPHIRNGNKAVIQINEFLRSKYRDKE
ncbi:hypothetical protein ACMV8I_18035 [Ewingella sp. S1.OA.A_B6]